MSEVVRLTCSNFLSERRKKASGWEKNVLYPMVMLILLAGTVRVRDQLTLFHDYLQHMWPGWWPLGPIPNFFSFLRASGCLNVC